MKKISNIKKKALPLFMAGITAATVLTPVTAMADDSTGEISIDKDVATVAAHRAAETAPMILGANLITTGSVNDVMLETFGSDYNINPNQYLYNTGITGKYSTNYGADGRIWKLEGTVAPTMADLVYGSVDTGADIFLGNAANSSGNTYSSDLTSLAYGCTTIEEMEQTMLKLAETIDALEESDDLTTLYKESATEIADDYVNYIKNTVSYVSNLINNGTLTKQTVAILSMDSDGSYLLYTDENQTGTSLNRAAEYLADVTTNVVDTATSGALTEKSTGCYVVDKNYTSIIENANIIVTTGFQGSTTITEESLKADGINITGTLLNTLPDSSYGIYMNSAENALGMVALIMAVYDNQTDNMDVSVEDAVAYYYSHFYHIKDEYVDYLADKHFEGCVNYDTSDDGSVSAYAAILK